MHTHDFRRGLFRSDRRVGLGARRGTAAQRLAPVVSKTLSDLEESVGVSLFRRAHNALTVTPEGEAMYQHALAMRSAAENALTPSASTRGTERRHRGHRSERAESVLAARCFVRSTFDTQVSR